MKIGFIQDYNKTHYKVYSCHFDYESIPEEQKAVMPEWVSLPDDYAPQSGMITLFDKGSGDISLIPDPEAQLAQPTIAEFVDRLAQIQQDQLIIMMALADLGGGM